ncbi:type I secretion system permease/ATPase [Sphingobium sufflavum]|uniref:type I secretion system permease/ATPase n=1 Tax=Sphingobium sufflavum TaxID=1129547 RepID=UPI001F28F292|nr:type I secretion system permease/ATPase [Sphingobium sufflavum]MCE7796307.1 type I secretion system permease/ATPase [Sphingobium sufflavum]
MAEVWAATHRPARLLGLIVVASCVLNLLLIGGSLYMMLVYDSVLPSRSISTLVGLLLLMLVTYAFQGFFDQMRSGMLADVGHAVDRALSSRVQAAISDMAIRGERMPGDGLGPMRDLEQIRGFITMGLATMIDLPWMIFFLATLFLLHAWLGLTTLIGMVVLMVLALFTNGATKGPSRRTAQVAAHRNNMASANLRHVDLFTALGMRERMEARWDRINDYYGEVQARLSGAVTSLGGTSKILRLALQSIILTVGALLVIDGKATGGIIFASSILSGRALAPVDQMIANWKGFAAARDGLSRLSDLIDQNPVRPAVMTQLPAPRLELRLEGVFAGPPGTQTIVVNGVDFTLRAGDACGVIGPSGAGKTSLGRVLTGVWPPVRGALRLDGGTLDQWAPAARGAFLGYLPQTVELLDGTVAENISRFDGANDSAAVIAAAQAAGVHELIMGLPNGYDTVLGEEAGLLSGGQRQRVGLARALYRDPFLVVLDEPNSNLDAEGEKCLQQAIAAVRRRKGIAIIISHQIGILAQVSHVLCLNGGRMEAFGPAAEVLTRFLPKAPPMMAHPNPPPFAPRGAQA